MIRTTFLAVIAASAVAGAAAAESVIEVHDPYARASNTMAGAAFMTLVNTGDADDRLIGVASGAAERTELHTHVQDGDVMRMMEVEEGFAVPAGGRHELARGGDHVMFMGLTAPFEEGTTLSVTLTFEQAGEVVVEIPVDQDRDMSGH